MLFAILSFQVGKWVATIGALARFALLGFFVLVIVAYGVKHGFHGIGGGGFTPSFSSFVVLVPLILFSLVGFELPSAAGEEMEDAANDVPAGIAKSVIATALLYGLPVLGILLVLPAEPGVRPGRLPGRAEAGHDRLRRPPHTPRPTAP